VRHRHLRNKIRGNAPERHAMFNNMVASLLKHGRVKTTVTRAKILRSMVEKTVTKATTLGDLLLKDRSKMDAQDRARLIHAMRMVRRKIKDRQVVQQLFDDVAPRYLGRPGGYTRTYKMGFRKGDGAPLAMVEFIEAEMPEREGVKKAEEGKEPKRRFGLFSRKKEEKAKEK
jgi:large subunit ribosomal protein L17